MKILTDSTNPWNDGKDHPIIPLQRFGDDFFIYEETQENTGMEFPERLNGATYGSVLLIMKDEAAVEKMFRKLGQLRDTLLTMLTAYDERRKLEQDKQAELALTRPEVAERSEQDGKEG